MGDADQSSGKSVSLDIRCEVEVKDVEEIAGFIALLQEMLGLAAIPNAEHLRSIVIAPKGKLPETVKAIIQQAGAGNNTYQPGTYRTQGIAFPTEREGQMECWIVLDESIIRGLTRDAYRPFETVSTLLEELLHVWVYSTLWEAQRASPASSKALISNDALWSFCGNVHNEYMANRRKSYLFATLPLYAVEGGYAPGLVKYPDPLGPIIESSKAAIVSIIVKAGSGQIPISESWIQLLNGLYRRIVEPLCREAAKREGCLDAQREGNIGPEEQLEEQAPTAASSRFYALHVAPYWQRLHVELERSYETFSSQPGETLTALDTMRDVLQEFLSHLGVRVDLEKQCAYFDGTVALSLKE